MKWAIECVRELWVKKEHGLDIDYMSFYFRGTEGRLCIDPGYLSKNLIDFHLSRESAQRLKEFLEECLKDERPDCCWDFKFQDGVTGVYTCKTCGLEHKSGEKNE